MGDHRSTGYSGAVQIKCCATDGKKARNLDFLPAISTCETCKRRVETMLDTI
jgi:hypothetical protein